MASRTMAVAAAVVAVVLLMQCCNVVLAARLLEGDGGWLQGKGVAGVGPLVMQLLPKDTPGTPGADNGCTRYPNHSPGGSCN